MSEQIDRLIDIVSKLRSPDGCPWDREQTHQSILSCFLDELYEFFETVEQKDYEHMREELGDLLLQIALHAQMANEQNKFDINDVARDISDKLIRRHPHVFGSVEVSSTNEVINNWEKIKKAEKGKEHRKYIVDDIPEALPALFRAEKVQRRVARVGFDWNDSAAAFDKVEEEIKEFRDALVSDKHEHAFEELGDIIFALVNVARHHNISAEDAVRNTTRKFIRRFKYIEDKFRECGLDIHNSTLQQMDIYWEESKKFVG